MKFLCMLVCGIVSIINYAMLTIAIDQGLKQQWFNSIAMFMFSISISYMTPVILLNKYPLKRTLILTYCGVTITLLLFHAFLSIFVVGFYGVGLDQPILTFIMFVLLAFLVTYIGVSLGSKHVLKFMNK